MDFAERIRSALADDKPELGDVFAAALRGGHPLDSVDLDAMLADVEAAVAGLEASRAERLARHADERRAGLELYERTRRARPDACVRRPQLAYASLILGGARTRFPVM